MVMSNYPQTGDLLKYAFDRLDQQMLNEYLSNISSITCDKETLNRMISDNELKIKTISNTALNNCISCCKTQSSKSKLSWIKRKNKQ